MSRIGKLPIAIPESVNVEISHNEVTVKGPKGRLCQNISKDILVEIDQLEKVVRVKPISDSKQLWAQWGLYRVLIQNMVTGVNTGFQKILEIVGVGYKAEMRGNNLQISAGYSHPVIFFPPKDVTLGIDGPLKIIVSGIDKQKVGQVAAEIRSVRPPEPYKGKGIHYQDETIIRKAGKTGAK